MYNYASGMQAQRLVIQHPPYDQKARAPQFRFKNLFDKHLPQLVFLTYFAT